MPDFQINVNTDTLRTFSEYIDSFCKTIYIDCSELTSALAKLQASMDDITVASMSDVVVRIDRILSDASPELESLSKRVTAYADFVDRLKTLASS